MKNLTITEKDISDGCVPPDIQFAKEIGFTSDKFEGFLWKTGNTVTLSIIISLEEGKGNVRKLIDAIKRKGYDIEVHDLSTRMFTICWSMGFKGNQNHMTWKNKIKNNE